VPIFELILIYTVVQLMGILPVSINSLGVSEGAFIILFGLVGISSVDALTVALLGRILLMLVSLSGGVLLFLKTKFSGLKKKAAFEILHIDSSILKADKYSYWFIFSHKQIYLASKAYYKYKNHYTYIY